MSCKDNFEVIYVHIKSRGVQGLVFVQRAFEKYTKNFYFENGEFGEVNLQPLLSKRRFHMFTHIYTAVFSIKTYFYEIKNVFYLKYLVYKTGFTKLLAVSESSIKKIKLPWTLFVILLT